MKESQIPQIAKAVLKKLNSCDSKDVCLDVKGDSYCVHEYNEDSPYSESFSWTHTIMEFNYSESEIPDQKHIENSIYDVFIKTI